MPQIHLELTDQVFAEAERRAAEAGFESVEEYIADIVSDDLAEVEENLDHLFTPERLAHIDRVVENVKAGGKTYTVEEVREHCANSRTDRN